MRRGTGELSLLLAAFIWGTCFVAQTVGLESVGPYTFQAVRCLLGAAVLTGVNVFRRKRSGTAAPMAWKPLLRGGVCCGVVLCIATNLQQLGLQFTTPGKSGFITSMYMVLVPILSTVLGKVPKLRHWFCVALAAAGLCLLSLNESLSLGAGDALTLVGAFFFAGHIIAVDRFAPDLDGVQLSCAQFWVVGLVTSVPMLALERTTLSGILAAGIPIAYAGVLSCAVAYTLQIIGQQRCDPVVATVLMSLESVFSVLGGLVLLGQMPTAREFTGCAVMFCAVLLSQIPIGSMMRRREQAEA